MKDEPPTPPKKKQNFTSVVRPPHDQNEREHDMAQVRFALNDHRGHGPKNIEVTKEHPLAFNCIPTSQPNSSMRPDSLKEADPKGDEDEKREE